MAEEKTKDAAEVKLSKEQQQVMDLVEKMTALELADLVKALEDKFGVSASAPVAAVAAPAGAAAGGEEEDEKSTFDVVLADAGSNKIGAIKAVKEITGVGLTEAKEKVESAPVAIQEGVDKEKAEELKGKLEEAGCKVELK